MSVGTEQDAPESVRAQELVAYLTAAADYPFAQLVSVKVANARDLVDLVVEPELAQDRVVPILNSEPIRLSFHHEDLCAPQVFSQRNNFPLELVHTTVDRGEHGRCLCIWEENWSDLRRNLTPQALVERIRDWFSRMARGALHQDGQPLEPLIPAASDTLVIPAGPPPTEWHLVYATQHQERWTVITEPQPHPNTPPGVPQFAIFPLRLPAQVHGALHARPYDLEGLRVLVDSMGGDLVRSFGDWFVGPDQLRASERRMFLLVSTPMLKAAGGNIEGWETWAFMPAESVRELGVRIGRTLYDAESGFLGPRIPPGSPDDLRGIKLFGWRVVQRLDRARARLLSGNNARGDSALVAIGAGAVGSNIVANTVRAGIGTWTIIDDDIVLPHNTVRQLQGNVAVGLPKAETSRRLVNQLLAEGAATDIRADVLAPGGQAEAVERAFAAADLVVDFSASPAVLGHLADHPAVKRGASMFFNPDGSDLVVLAEDGERALRLDEAEAQYFLAAAADPRLTGHLDAARLDLVRYANACQDLSRPLPPWQVQTLCGIGSGRLISVLADSGSLGLAWRLDPETSAVTTVAFELSGVRRIVFPRFRLTISEVLLAKMCKLRRGAAPNETGGVLIGSFDLRRGVIHVVDAVPAPPDSRQSPTYFIRGKKDLQPLVDGLTVRSAGTLGYIGEWHSHPDGAGVAPSRDDEGVWRHLREHIDPTGSPYLMVICAASETLIRAGWRPHEAAEGVVDHGRR
jgi:integrative and conjugative element protein (TIGR02256 family)